MRKNMKKNVTRNMANARTLSSLQALGLTDVESAVYLALLSFGRASVSDVARRTHLHRSKVAETMERLMEVCLVSSHVLGKRTVFAAEHPDGLRNIVERRTQELEVILPTLTEQFSQRATQPSIRVFTGRAGVTEMYRDVLRSLKKGDVFFRYESPEDYVKQNRYLPELYHERACRKGEIEKFVITNERTAERKPKQLQRAVKVVPSSFDPFTYNLTQIIYANKVAFIDFDTETAWLIENERFATFQRQLFKLLFHRL